MRRLLRWLLVKFGVLPKGDVNLFRPAERLLYGYWNGKKTVWEDPLVLFKKLMAVGPQLSIDIKVANSPIQGNVEANNSMMKQIREIFNVDPYNSVEPTKGGLTETELSALLGHFLNYCDDVKKKQSGSATPPPTSPVSVSSTPPAQESVPATTSTSDTNSTGEVPNTETPTPLPSESASPSDSSSPPLIILGPTQMERVTP